MALIRDKSKAQLAFQVEGGGLDQFLVVRYRGSEGLCQLYRFEIELTSSEEGVAFNDVVGKPAVLSIATDFGGQWFHGIVSRFEMTGETTEQTYYRAELVPDLWLLTHRYNSRIFQQKSVKDIISQVLTDGGIASDRFDVSQLKESYEPLDYCVQYRETDYNFICRLMEEEGIRWYFEQSKDAAKLILADSGTYAPIEGEPALPYHPPTGMNVPDEHVFRFREGQCVRPGAVVLRDFNFENPALNLESTSNRGQDTALEFSDYPGEYVEQGPGQKIATRRAEEFESTRILGVGQSNSPRLAVGRTFDLIEHPSEPQNKSYLLTSMSHLGEQATYRTTTGSNGRASILDARTHQSLLQAKRDDNQMIRELAEALLQIVSRFKAGDQTAHRALTQWLYHAGQVSKDLPSTAAASGGNPLEALTIPNLLSDVARSTIIEYDAPVYECRFECIPADVTYRPPRVSPWPVVRGTQTARVVGPQGEEIYTDEYGRVKVQFNWDREGGFDESSSCWIRVSHGMAGGEYGMLFLPRIGQEVIVDFLEGNPDKPIIIGRVYNADHMPPYTLPDEKTKSVIKGQSTIGGGGCNEIRFEDLKDSEQFFIQAERQMDTRVKASHFHTVGGSYHVRVGGEKGGTLSGELRELIYKAKHVHTKGEVRTLTDMDESHKILGSVGTDIGGPRTTTVGGDVVDKFGANHKHEVATTYAAKALAIKLEASTGIELKCGGSSIILTPAAIFIVGGPLVNINSGSGPPVGPVVANEAAAKEAEDASAADRSQPGRDTRYDGGGAITTGEVPPAIPGWEPEDEEKKKEEPPPTIEAKWSKPEVTPDHNNAWKPATPPTDVIPEEAKVQLLVATTNVPDGKAASITIHHCHTKAMIPEGSLRDLEVRGNAVVDKNTGQPPEWVFEAKHHAWDPWDKPFFYFKVTVSYKGLHDETTDDYETREAECLRVLYWHACVSDAIADTPAGGGLSTQQEMNEIGGILDAVDKTKVLKQPFNQANVPVNLWGSVLRNTYAYHRASHGDIVDRTTGAQLNQPGDPNPPTVPVGNWRSVICIGNTNMGDAEVSQKDNVPSTPRYLAYMDTCVAGWEPSFGNAFIRRGTQNYLAFRCYIPDGDARQMARNFYRKWCNDHKCDPSKIPAIFFDVGAPYYGSMRPILMGRGAGAIQSPLRRAWDAIAGAISGFVDSITSIFS